MGQYAYTEIDLKQCFELGLRTGLGLSVNRAKREIHKRLKLHISKTDFWDLIEARMREQNKPVIDRIWKTFFDDLQVRKLKLNKRST